MVEGCSVTEGGTAPFSLLRGGSNSLLEPHSPKSWFVGSLVVGLNLIDTFQILLYVHTTYTHATMIFLCSLTSLFMRHLQTML